MLRIGAKPLFLARLWPHEVDEKSPRRPIGLLRGSFHPLRTRCEKEAKKGPQALPGPFLPLFHTTIVQIHTKASQKEAKKGTRAPSGPFCAFLPLFCLPTYDRLRKGPDGAQRAPSRPFLSPTYDSCQKRENRAPTGPIPLSLLTTYVCRKEILA